jgi:hypothetical protein
MEQPKILVTGATGKTGRAEHGVQFAQRLAMDVHLLSGPGCEAARDHMFLRIQEGTQSMNQASEIQEHYTLQELPGRITAGKDRQCHRQLCSESA